MKMELSWRNFCVILCGICVVYGQVPPNPLFQSQDAINLYHDYYEDMKSEIRGYMSGYVSDVTRDLLGVLSATMDTWRRQQQHDGAMFRRLVAAKSTPEVGETVRVCSVAAFDHIFELQDDVFHGLEEWTEYIAELQMSVVQKLTEFDIVRRYDYFIDEFNPVITEAHNRFQFEFVPSLEVRLRNMRDAHTGIVEDYRQCISSVLRRE